MNDQSVCVGKDNGRIIAFDLLRIIAIALVVLLHTVSPIVGNGDSSSMDFIVANIINGISRIGVPMFFMVSGALMLNTTKELSIKTIICKYVKNIVILLVFWSIFYALLYEIIVPLIITKQTISLNNFLLSIVNGATHLWFLFVLIGLYLITPILRTFVNNKNKKLAIYFIVLASIFCLLPKTIDFILYALGISTSNIVSEYFAKFSMGFVLDCTIYYVLGWLLVNCEIKKKCRIVLYILGAISLIYMILSVQLFSSLGNYVGESVYNNLTINVCLYAVAAFVFIWNKCKDKEFERSKNLIISLSNKTFGVYAIHVAALYLIGHFFIGKNIFIRILVCWGGALVLSFAITYVLSKIPIIKKIVRG